MKKALFILIISLTCMMVTMPLYASFEGFWTSQSITKSSGMMFGGNQDKIEKQTTFYKKGKMRIESDDGEIIIIRPDLELSWQINKTEGTYTEIKFAEIKSGMDMVKNMMESEEMQNALKDMPPEQREMMEKMMGKSKKHKSKGLSMDIKVVHTGKTEKVNGEKCEIVKVMSGDKTMMTFWMAKNFDMGRDIYKQYEAMGIFSKASNKEFAKLKGFPMKTVTNMGFGGMSTNVTSTVTKIKKTRVSDKKFELPKGFKKLENPMMQGMMKR